MNEPLSLLTNRVLVEKERLESELARNAEAAFSRRGLVPRYFQIHGQNFRFRFAGDELAVAMTRALAHLAIEPTSEVGLTIDCWDVGSTALAFPMPDWPAHLFTTRGEIRGLDGPLLRIAYFDWLKLLNVYFPERKQAYYCLAQADPFPLQQLGSPALTLFSWWFNTLGWQFTHAGAVGTESGGALIIGQGGAGKSTLAFSTLGTELKYLSDDYCVLLPGNPPHVLSLYNSGKLTENSLALLPHLKSLSANNDDPGREKAIFFLHEQFPGQQLLRAPLKAIVFPDVTREETGLSRMEPRDIFGVVSHSTMVQVAGSTDTDFLRIMKLARSVPIYKLRYRSDWAAAHRLLLSLCES